MNSTTPSAPPSNWPVNILAAMVFLIPAVGVPNEYMLQDTLKSAIAAFGILLAALAFVWQLGRSSTQVMWHPMLGLPLALMVYALGSIAWSHAYLASVEAVRWFLVSLLIWTVLNTTHAQNLPRLLWAIHGGTLVASIWVALQFWWGWRFFPQAAPPASTFANRNFFAEYAVSVVPISAYLVLNQRYSRWLGLLAFSLAFNVIAILMTGTRSALFALGLATSLVLLAIVRFHHVLACVGWTLTQRIKMVALFLAAITIMGMVPSGSADIGKGRTPFALGGARSVSMVGALQGKDVSFSTRLEMWKSTARMIMATPWRGVGAGAWEVYTPLYQRNDTPLEIDYYAHNDHLQMLSEYGVLVGGVALAVLLAHALISVSGIARFAHPLDTLKTALGAMAAISLMTLLIVANAGFPLHLAPGSFLLALLPAITIQCGNSPPRERGHPLPWPPANRQVLLVFLLLCLVVAAVITQRAALGEYKLVHAIEQYGEILRESRNSHGDIEGLHRTMVEDIQQAIVLVPHYRKLISESGDNLIALGDWESAIPVWERLAESRPYIPAVWTILAIAYARTQQHMLAHQALGHVQRLRPKDIGTKTLEIQLLNEAGDTQIASQMLKEQLDKGTFNHDMLQLAYVVGYQNKELALAIQAMHLRNAHWPEEAADGHMRLGKLYADPLVNEHKKALVQFTLGLASVPQEERSNYLSQVPEQFRALIDGGRNERRSGTLGAGHNAARRSARH